MYNHFYPLRQALLAGSRCLRLQHVVFTWIGPRKYCTNDNLLYFRVESSKPPLIMARSSRQNSFHLANQLLDVIRDAKLEPGHHLREQQLADLIGVSRTPIRSALNLLAKRGIGAPGKNKGNFLGKPSD